MIFNTTPQMLTAALDGYGLAYIPEDLVQEHIAAGRLEQVLDDWCQPFPGYHLYYPSRRQASPAFSLVLNALRDRA
jgi:DNA-binding transcriptional LysR family regulator